MTLHRGWCRTWYNGWSPEQRQATIPVQRTAFRQGLIQRPTTCSVCGFDKPQSPGSITLHLENYSVALTGYGCCAKCHSAIHARFVRPGRWLRLLDRVGHAGWATYLTLDAKSQWRPFEVSYPQGLPLA